MYPDIPQLQKDSILSKSIQCVKQMGLHSPDYDSQEQAEGGSETDDDCNFSEGKVEFEMPQLNQNSEENEGGDEQPRR